MSKITKIEWNRNELFEIEFYKDKECTEVFDFNGAENLYIELKNGDCSPLMSLRYEPRANIYIPYIAIKGNYNIFSKNSGVKFNASFTFLDDITPNLSKYIPEDNAVLFLSEEEASKHNALKNYGYRKIRFIYKNGQLMEIPIDGIVLDILMPDPKKFTIIISYLHSQNIQEINNIAKKLQEKYGVEEVNLFALHCFVHYYYNSVFHPNNIQQLIDVYGSEYAFKESDIISFKDYEYLNECRNLWNQRFQYIDKLITTNSTGILSVQNTERLQVIDCLEIFEEYLKENN